MIIEGFIWDDCCICMLASWFRDCCILIMVYRLNSWTDDIYCHISLWITSKIINPYPITSLITSSDDVNAEVTRILSQSSFQASVPSLRHSFQGWVPFLVITRQFGHIWYTNIIYPNVAWENSTSKWTSWTFVVVFFHSTYTAGHFCLSLWYTTMSLCRSMCDVCFCAD